MSKLVTSQPVPSAPMEEKKQVKNEILTEEIAPTAPPLESVVVRQPTVATMPVMTAINPEKIMYAQAETMEDLKLDEEEKKRRQRNQDFCCYACADSCADDTWCWYIFCRLYCRCLGICCESFANCCDSCGDCCANCLHDCCESDPNQGGNDSGCFCCDGDSNNGCCSGDAGTDGDVSSGDCDCDCSGCFD